MASSHNAINPVPYIGFSVLAVLFAATLDSCSSPNDDKAAAAPPPATTTQQTAAVKNPAISAAYEENIKPIGTVATADKSPPAAARSGEDVYNAACTACHAAGVMDAPKLDKASWEPRIAKGLDGLVHSAINGLNAMPPRGGNPAITDEEIHNAVAYMTTQAGFDLAAGAPAAADTAQAAPAETAQAAAPTEAAQAAAPAVAASAAQAPEAQQASTATAPSMPVAPGAPQAPEAPSAPAAPVAPEASTQTAPLSMPEGETVYRSVCFSCHDVGIGNSPMIGDKNAWSARIASGTEALYGSTINGKGLMPARGGNPQLSDAQLKSAVDYMLNMVADGAAPAEAAPAAAQEATPAQETTPAEAAPAPAQEAAPAQVSGIDGQAIYKSLCFSCHDAGILNAPKPGDKAAWAPRIAAGENTLYDHSLHGFNTMPAKGGNPALSDDEVKAAVDWMVSQSQ